MRMRSFPAVVEGKVACKHVVVVVGMDNSAEKYHCLLSSGGTLEAVVVAVAAGHFSSKRCPRKHC